MLERKLPIKLRNAIRERDGWKCVCCRDATGWMHVDYIVPTALGGAWDEPANLQTLCKMCNSRKGKRERCPCQDEGYTPAPSTLAMYLARGRREAARAAKSLERAPERTPSPPQSIHESDPEEIERTPIED